MDPGSTTRSISSRARCNPRRTVRPVICRPAPLWCGPEWRRGTAGSPYLDSDAVFAVKQSLVTTFTEDSDADTAAELGLVAPFEHADIDLVLQPSDRA